MDDVAADGPEPEHAPVMLAEVLEALAPVRDGGLIVDATLGLGGHAEALLAGGARVLGLDRDPESLARARTRLLRFESAGRLRLRHADYRRLLALLAAEATGPIDGIVADLGVSSYQMLDAERGFSFRSAAPLDMRLDRSGGGVTAADLVNGLDEEELARLLRDYGEEPDARRIARALVRQRQGQPLRTTAELALAVAAAKPRPRPGRPPRLHPATLAFQALRIAVNDELAGIDRFVADAVAALREGGRIAVIAFHSLEDRQVKTALRLLERGCDCPPELPFCACGKQPQVRLLGRRGQPAGAAEVARNPRARSARLRAAEKLGSELAPEVRRAA